MSFIEHNGDPGKPRAIETLYAGYRFRSRLEARWAVFFDALGLQWEYEPEGFDLDGVWYLPDFRVKTPQGEDIWYEIKPKGVETDDKFTKFCAVLGDWTARNVLLSGDPVDVIGLLAFDRSGYSEICTRCGLIKPLRKGGYGYSEIHECYRYVNGERVRWGDGDEYMMLCYACDMETPSGGGHDDEPGFLGVACRPHKGWVISPENEYFKCLERLEKAALKARQARFEHGEKP